jgi:hypothetical protein
VQVAEVAAAANPILRRVVPTIKRSIERWADEDAAVAVGDRPLAAQALARAALAAAGRPVLRPGLAIADGRVTERVQLLLAPSPGVKVFPVAILVLAGAISWATAVAVSTWANNLVQVAEAVYHRR